MGNWNEDVYLADEVAADFERLKASGGLKHQRTAKIKEWVDLTNCKKLQVECIKTFVLGRTL